MSERLIIELPNFDDVERETGTETRNALTLIWSILNQELLLRVRTVNEAKDTLRVKVLSSAPASDQHNFDTDRATICYFTGSTGIDLTGIRNGTEGAILILHTTGSGTITLKDQSGSSSADNQIITSTGGNRAMATDKSAILLYLNAKWREFITV
jgi:hypothetical protein